MNVNKKQMMMMMMMMIVVVVVIKDTFSRKNDRIRMKLIKIIWVNICRLLLI